MSEQEFVHWVEWDREVCSDCGNLHNGAYCGAKCAKHEFMCRCGWRECAVYYENPRSEFHRGLWVDQVVGEIDMNKMMDVTYA